MTGANHILTGALIGGIVAKPLIALPIALASHFVLDVLPHYGEDNSRNKTFKYVLLGDIALSVAVLGWILLSGTSQALLMVACAVVALSPDILWLPYLIADIKGRTKPLGWFSRIAKKIQWGERPWGIVIEVAWTIGMIILLARFI